MYYERIYKLRHSISDSCKQIYKTCQIVKISRSKSVGCIFSFGLPIRYKRVINTLHHICLYYV